MTLQLSASRAEPQKTVALTGAGSRLGFRLARWMWEDDRIIPVFLTSDLARFEAASGIVDAGTNVVTIELTDPDSILSAFETIRERFGGLDAFINNAAVNTVPGFSDFVRNADDERVRDSFLVNSVAPLLCIRHALAMNRGGRHVVINVLSLKALRGGKRHVEYGASKAALHNATLTLSRDYPQHAFRNVMSGHIDTGKGGIDPAVMWDALRNMILDPAPPSYEEIYLMGRREYFVLLLRNWLDQWRSLRRIPPAAPRGRSRT